MNLTTHERTSYFNNIMSCYTDGDNIFQTDYMGNKVGSIGVTNKRYLELKEICDKYYDKLVELGAIKKEKTPEELAQEQTEMMTKMMEQMKYLQDELSAIKESNNVQHSNVTSGSMPIVQPERPEPIEIRSSNQKGAGSIGKK